MPLFQESVCGQRSANTSNCRELESAQTAKRGPP